MSRLSIFSDIARRVFRRSAIVGYAVSLGRRFHWRHTTPDFKARGVRDSEHRRRARHACVRWE